MPSRTVDARPFFNLPLVPLVVALFLVVGVLACDVAGPSGGREPEASPVSLSLSAKGADAAGTAQAPVTQGVATQGIATRVFTDPSGNRLQLDRVELILHAIEFGRAADDCATGGDGDCEKLEAGPKRVALPLESDRPVVVMDTSLPVGVWEEGTFEVDDASDPSLLEGTNFPPEASIRAQGTFTPAGGTEQSFTYITDLEAERDVEFEPPIQVIKEEPTNVTFSVDVNAWFRKGDSTLVHPVQAVAGGPFEDLVEDNIERSIEGFEDHDRDGKEDKDEDENEEEEEEGDDDDRDMEIEVDLDNTGPDSDASGEAEFEHESDRTEFTVEVEDLRSGTYDVVVADTTRGQVDVKEGDDDGNEDTEGEIEFRDPPEDGHPLLDFDPRGRHVAIVQNETVYLEADFPSTGSSE